MQTGSAALSAGAPYLLVFCAQAGHRLSPGDGKSPGNLPPLDCPNDTWTATNTVNAPEARDGETAVWTGTEMIVWGGENIQGIQLNTGARYNPATDTWTATSTTNAPSARYYHAAVWTGSEMIVWGGFGGSTRFNTGGRYNPLTDSWTPTSVRMRQPRESFPAESGPAAK